MSEFSQWLRERESTAKGLGAIHVHQTAQPTITSDVLVPALQAAGVGFALGLGTLGITLVVGVSWDGAWRWAAGVGLGSWGVTTVRFVLEHRAMLRAPMEAELEKLALLRGDYGEPMPEPGSDDPWRVINGGKRARPMLPATVDHAVEPIAPEPESPAEIKMLYSFIAGVWPGGDATRRGVMDLGFSRSQWERYVGGQRGKVGLESGRGLLDRAGCVQKTPNGWVLCASLEEAFSFNDALRAYADAKAELVTCRDGRDGRDGLGQLRDDKNPAHRQQGRG